MRSLETAYAWSMVTTFHTQRVLTARLSAHVTSSVCAFREGAKRAVSALVDVAPLGPGGGDLPQTRRHTAPRTLKGKSPTLTRQKTAA